jgi:hypothetical protein
MKTMAGTIITAIPTNALNGDAALKSNDAAGVRSDTLDLKRWAVGFMLNTATTIKVRTAKGGDVTLTPAAGVPIGLEIKRVFNTGTTAANADIVLFYTDI